MPKLRGKGQHTGCPRDDTVGKSRFALGAVVGCIKVFNCLESHHLYADAGNTVRVWILDAALVVHD